MYSVTPEEYAMFPDGIETAQVATHPEDHIVLIEMFHQLHCLVRSIECVAVSMLTSYLPL